MAPAWHRRRSRQASDLVGWSSRVTAGEGFEPGRPARAVSGPPLPVRRLPRRAYRRAEVGLRGVGARPAASARRGAGHGPGRRIEAAVACNSGQQLAPNPRLQRTRAALLLQNLRGKSRSLGGVRRAPLSRKPLGRTKPACLAIAMVIGLGVMPAATGAGSPDRHCEKGSHSFQETAGVVVFSLGEAAQLRTALTFALVVRDDEGECARIRELLVKKLGAGFPQWKYVTRDSADLTIVYESGFSLCLDNCEPRPLPQGADAELNLKGMKACWSAGSQWRGRGRLVSLFVSALKRAVDARAA